jgi:hypothetical protein
MLSKNLDVGIGIIFGELFSISKLFLKAQNGPEAKGLEW